MTGLGPLRTHFELSTRRGLTKFVGRESELEQMRRALEQAMSGHGQIVAVMAEAGTGKSRLFYEFKATMPAECKVLEAYSVSHGKASAWLPVLELLRNYFGIQDADDAASRREKVRAALAALDPALARRAAVSVRTCSASSRVPTRSRRWIRRSSAGARSTRSSASSCAKA